MFDRNRVGKRYERVLVVFRRLKKILRKIYYCSILVPVIAQIKLKHILGKKCIYFIATPLHGNLGDHAIVYAQYQLMKELGLRNNVVEIYRLCYEVAKKKLQKLIRTDELIVIDGGGNMGTLWPGEDLVMRDIIKCFPDNVIYIMPQTAFYTDTPEGQSELKKTISVYQKHKKLTVFCRDNTTYELLQTKFKGVRSYYTPDMVLFLQGIRQQEGRNGILLCFRNDLECMRPCKIDKEIRTYILQKGYDIKSTSTVINRHVVKMQRKKYLFKKWNEFSSAKLVVTDRLHGMIFSAITGTPCIALDNVSHKIKAGYEWVKFLPYIDYINYNDSGIETKIDRWMNAEQGFKYDNMLLHSQYNIIKEEIVKFLW